MNVGADPASLRQCLAIMALPATDRVIASDALDPITQLVRAFLKLSAFLS